MKPPVYQTERFSLKPYQKNDQKRFIEIGSDLEVRRFMGDPDLEIAVAINDEKELFKRIFDIYNQQEKRWFWIWGIYEKNRLVAHFELKETEHTAQDELEIVYMVHPSERKRGVMTEILSFIKEQQSVWNRKIIATVDKNNAKSISLLAKWGIIKKEMIKDKETNKEYLKIYLE